MATSTTCFGKTIIGRNYRFPGQTSPVIKLSIKSKKNNNVNLSSKQPVFGTMMMQNFFVNYQFSDKGRTIVLSVTSSPLGIVCTQAIHLLSGHKVDWQPCLKFFNLQQCQEFLLRKHICQRNGHIFALSVLFIDEDEVN